MIAVSAAKNTDIKTNRVTSFRRETNLSVKAAATTRATKTSVRSTAGSKT
jgi:hypothetical protein